MINVATLAVAAIVWTGATIALWRNRRWLVFYIVGALGIILLMMLAAAVLDLDTVLEGIEARQVVGMAAFVGIPLDVLGQTGLAIPNHTGWAVFDIGIECSALLEMSAIVGLIGFYPAFTRSRKTLLVAVGLAVTYVMNLLRILLIVAIINSFGTTWVFAAHAIFGRIFFFGATVTLFWYIVTRPTMHVVKVRLEEGADG